MTPVILVILAQETTFLALYVYSMLSILYTKGIYLRVTLNFASFLRIYNNYALVYQTIL